MNTKVRRIISCSKALALAAAACAVLLVGRVDVDADSQGTITAATANIRALPNTTSEVVGSVKQGDHVDITEQVTAADGKIWYKIFVDANSMGYIRYDLLDKGTGTIPTGTLPEGTQTTGGNAGNTGNTGTATPSVVSTDGVAMVEPVGATAKGDSKVRSDASTRVSQVGSCKKDAQVTILGTKPGTANADETWYLVEYSGGQGYMRSDLVSVSGELVPKQEEVPVTDVPDTPVVDDTPTEIVETPPYETRLDGDTYYLYDNDNGKRYMLPKMIEDAQKLQDSNDELEQQAVDMKKSLSTARVWMVIFIVLSVLLALVCVFLFLKLREAMQSASIAKAKQRGSGVGGGTGRPTNKPSDSKRPTGSGATGRPSEASSGTRRPGAAQPGSQSGRSQATGRPQSPGGRPATPPRQAPKPAPAANPAAQRTAAPARPSAPTQGPRPQREVIPGETTQQVPTRRPTGNGPKNFMSEDDIDYAGSANRAPRPRSSTLDEEE